MVEEDEGVPCWAVWPPAARHTMQTHKVGQVGPEAGNSKAGTGGNNGGGMGRRVGGAKVEDIHAPPAAVHGCHRSQTHHLPHTGVHAWRRAGQPELGHGDGRGGGLVLGDGSRDGGSDGHGDRAGPEVVVPVSGGAATKAGLVQVEAGGSGEGVVHQAPIGLLVAVFLTEGCYRGLRRNPAGCSIRQNE